MGLLAALLVLYYETSTRLWQAGTWWDVAWLVFVLIPAVFALVLLLLPLHDARGLLGIGLAFAVLAAVLTIADVEVFANFARLAATACLGWWFLGFFETVSWVVKQSPPRAGRRPAPAAAGARADRAPTM